MAWPSCHWIFPRTKTRRRTGIRASFPFSSHLILSLSIHEVSISMRQAERKLLEEERNRSQWIDTLEMNDDEGWGRARFPSLNDLGVLRPTGKHLMYRDLGGSKKKKLSSDFVMLYISIRKRGVIESRRVGRNGSRLYRHGSSYSLLVP